jgi:single-strand DNA-binding protein
MENVNHYVCTGNLTRDPELRATPSGTSVAKLRIAVNSRRKNAQSGEWEDKPNFFDVTVWGKSGENAAKYLSKGRLVLVEGRLDWQEWEKDEQKRQRVEIIAEKLTYLPSGKGKEATGGDEAPSDAPEPEPVAASAGASGDDDIPF